MKKDLVYVCSPLSAEKEEGIKANMAKAKEYANTISEQCKCRAIAPHSFLPEYLDDRIPAEREIGLRFGLDIIKACKKVYVCGNRISSGMQKEIEYAKSLGIPVVYWDTQTKNKSRITITVIESEGD